MQNNLAVLTQSHKAIAAKKKAKREQIKEILFDDDARREFLTGFHKRKLAKADAARKKAIEREKQERLESRREQRRMLRERAKENAEEVEMAYGALLGNGDDGVWAGISGTSDEKGKQKEEEYEDEEILATVTVVEDFDPDSFIHGPRIKTDPATRQPLPMEIKPPTKPSRDATLKKKSKSKKIRYETKDARKLERTKQRARRTEKAELAGGKASRKRFSSASRKKGGSKQS